MSACKGLFADRFSNFFLKKKKNQKPVFDDEEGILYIYIYIYIYIYVCVCVCVCVSSFSSEVSKYESFVLDSQLKSQIKLFGIS
jgi:hypothetical protein